MAENLTGDNERFLRHLLLLGQATPLAIKAVINHETSKRGKTLRCLLLEKKETIRYNYSSEFSTLFPENKVNSHLDSWDIHSNCVAVLVLFESIDEDKLEAIKCVRDQRNDLDDYAITAALSFAAFDNKWKTLHHALLVLIKDMTDQDTHKCKRMMHSFYSESILVNYGLIIKMQQTRDVDLQVQMAIGENIFPEIESDEPYIPVETATFSLGFIEELKDTLVNVGEAAVLKCKLNEIGQSVEWIKNYKPFITTDTIKLLNDKCSHWMVISEANPADSGLYSCVCEGVRTSAWLKVSEDQLIVIQDLSQEEVMEHMDVSLVCKVFWFNGIPIWRHNSKAIEPSNRIIASSNKLEHKLTILNATILDDGEYSVGFGVLILKTKLTVKGDIDTLHQKQLKECVFKNWIRAVLGLKYLKSGLEDVSDEFVQRQHVQFLRKFQNAKPCSHCKEATLLKGKACPNKVCSELYQLIVDEHRFKKPELRNTVIQNWCSVNDPWNLALCYINISGYTGKASAKEIDCAALLSIFINNKYFNASLGNVDTVGLKLFKKAKDMRNELVHSPNYELSNNELKHCINLFKSVLEVKDMSGKSPLLTDRKVQEAIVNLNELQQKEISLLTSDELRQTLREHAMSEAAEKVKEAYKENKEKLQQLEEKLKCIFFSVN